jgi:hypothetical protein
VAPRPSEEHGQLTLRRKSFIGYAFLLVVGDQVELMLSFLVGCLDSGFAGFSKQPLRGDQKGKRSRLQPLVSRAWRIPSHTAARDHRDPMVQRGVSDPGRTDARDYGARATAASIQAAEEQQDGAKGCEVTCHSQSLHKVLCRRAGSGVSSRGLS